MSLGLRRGTVKLEPHDLRWEEEAGKAIEMIKSILGEDAVDIQHVGSTAISAISAKTIIDIVVGVKDLSRILQYHDQLGQEGMIFRNSDVANQWLYVMGDFEKDTRTHHIHVVIWDGEEWNDYVNFRDYLNGNMDVALQYQQLKLELERRFSDDRDAYTMGKHALITDILEQARQWRVSK